MDILFLFFKSLFVLLSLPFRLAALLWARYRGEGFSPDINGADESYDFPDERDETSGELNYSQGAYGNQEISNERGWRPTPSVNNVEDRALGFDDSNAKDDSSIVLDHHALFVRHESRQVLVVDYELPSMPSWLEYQKDIGHFTIVMADASVAHIDLTVGEDYIKDLEEESRILLVTSGDNEKIVHHLMFLLK
jgi:hypothetical protein